MNVSIYGIGNFGYAFLKHLDSKNTGSYRLTAYDYNQKRIDYLNTNRSHPFLHKNVKLSNNIQFVSDTKQLLKDCDVLLLAIPSTVTREAMKIIRAQSTNPIIIINTAKSLDKDNGQRLSTIVAEELDGIDYSYALLAGGTIASDLFRSEPLGADIACQDQEALETLKQLFESDNLNIYGTSDVLGVEYAAAFKNVVSILAGAVKGMGLSYGSETHIISRTAQLIADACVDKLGAQPSTFAIGSQCWGNDMWMSCTGNTRNREFGKLIGSGTPVADVLNQMTSENKLAEGVNTLKIITNIKEIYDIIPIRLLYDIVVQRTVGVESIRDYLNS